MSKIIEEEEHVVKENYSEDSFQRTFWEQQKDASSNSGPGMCWHPLMIKWCLYLRHQSSKAYESLRDSGCVRLPSQRTLRDYSNCLKASTRFSADVDKKMFEAAQLGSCKSYQMLVIILLDEMHLQKDLVYDKNSGCVVVCKSR